MDKESFLLGTKSLNSEVLFILRNTSLLPDGGYNWVPFWTIFNAVQERVDPARAVHRYVNHDAYLRRTGHRNAEHPLPMQLSIDERVYQSRRYVVMRTLYDLGARRRKNPDTLAEEWRLRPHWVYARRA